MLYHNLSASLSRKLEVSLPKQLLPRDFQGLESVETIVSPPKHGVRRHFHGLAAISLAACVVMPIAAQPAEDLRPAQVSRVQTSKPAEIENYWTAERLLNAKPFEVNPQLGTEGRPLAAAQSAKPGDAAGSTASAKVAGAPPSRSPDRSASKVLVPKSALEQRRANLLMESQGVIPDASSPIGATFTTSQVFPADATVTYPYSTVGALFWTDPADGSDWFCSASVLRPRVVATAGHCVATPASSDKPARFHTNFVFMPAFRNGNAPFGVFTSYLATTTATWFFSDGSVPNAQDVGLLDINDLSGFKIGDYTGYLGYWTNQLSSNNVTMLGYPCNLDGCEVLEANYAQTFEFGGNNTYIFGSNFGGGSSGGPYIRDFGWKPSGALTTEGGNWLIAVNSYGPTDLSFLYSGASNLNDEFLGLLSSACSSAGTGGC
jgi:V8-like Glu-specific endopeptidase